MALKIRLHLAPWLHALLSSLALTFVMAAYSALELSDPSRLLALATWWGVLKFASGTVVLKLLGWLLNRFKVLDPPTTVPVPIPTPPPPPSVA